MANILNNREFTALVPLDETLKLHALTYPTDNGTIHLYPDLSYRGLFGLWVWRGSRPTVIKNATILDAEQQPVMESVGDGFSHKIGMAAFDSRRLLDMRESCKFMRVVYTLDAPGVRTQKYLRITSTLRQRLNSISAQS